MARATQQILLSLQVFVKKSIIEVSMEFGVFYPETRKIVDWINKFPPLRTWSLDRHTDTCVNIERVTLQIRAGPVSNHNPVEWAVLEKQNL